MGHSLRRRLLHIYLRWIISKKTFIQRKLQQKRKIKILYKTLIKLDPYYTQKRFFLKNQDLSRFYYNPVFAHCWELTAAFGNAVVITENPLPDSSKKIAMVLIFFKMQFWLKKKNLLLFIHWLFLNYTNYCLLYIDVCLCFFSMNNNSNLLWFLFKYSCIR